MWLWSRIVPYLLAGAAAVAGVAAAVAKIRSETRQDVENEHAARNATGQQKATDAYLAAGGDPRTVRDRLRDPTQPW